MFSPMGQTLHRLLQFSQMKGRGFASLALFGSNDQSGELNLLRKLSFVASVPNLCVLTCDL